MKNLPKTLRIPLERALSVMRPSGSKEEAQFRAWICSTYSNLDRIDEAGNLYFRIPKLDGTRSETLFIAHCDTVHNVGGENLYTVKDDVVTAGGDCLGADNGAGVAILCHMMSNRVPGTFILSTGEELGGIGARHIAHNYTELSTYKRAITFDRRGTSDVITHQGGERCCSEEFGESLADALNEHGLLYTTSSKGVYTDTKEFIGYIAEGTNLSTGYFCEHGPKEHLDLQHFGLLAIAAVRIDWESLPTSRIPKKEKYSGYGTYLPSANLEDSMPPVEQWGGMDGVADYEDQIFELEDAVHLAIAGNTSYLQITLTAQLAEITGVTFDECAKFVYVNKLKPEILEELDWGQSFETLADQMLIIAAPEIM